MSDWPLAHGYIAVYDESHLQQWQDKAQAGVIIGYLLYDSSESIEGRPRFGIGRLIA
jgi:hypothetical protein